MEITEEQLDAIFSIIGQMDPADQDPAYSALLDRCDNLQTPSVGHMCKELVISLLCQLEICRIRTRRSPQPVPRFGFPWRIPPPTRLPRLPQPPRLPARNRPTIQAPRTPDLDLAPNFQPPPRAPLYDEFGRARSSPDILTSGWDVRRAPGRTGRPTSSGQPPAPPPSTPSHSSYSSIPAVNNFRWARKNGFAGRYVRSQLWKATANTVQTTATGLVMSAPSLIQMVPIY